MRLPENCHLPHHQRYLKKENSLQPRYFGTKSFTAAAFKMSAMLFLTLPYVFITPNIMLEIRNCWNNPVGDTLMWETVHH